MPSPNRSARIRFCHRDRWCGLQAVHSLSIAYVVASGCERSLLDEVAELERRRVRVQVMILNGRTGRVLADPVVVAAPSGNGHSPVRISRAWLSRAAAWIADEAMRHGVVHLHACGSVAAAAATRDAARLVNLGFSYAAGPDRAWLKGASIARYLTDARFIAVRSRDQVLSVGQHDGALARRAYVLRQGIDVRPFTFQRIRPRATGRILVFLSGSDVAAARQLVAVLPEVDVEGQHTTVSVVAPSVKPAAVRSLDSGRRDGRRLVPVDAAPAADIAATAAAYDVVVWLDGARAAVEEAPPAGVLQAMAVGVPVVHVTSTGHDVIEDGRSGFVIRPGSPDDLTRALRLAMWNEGMRRRFARAARRRVEREFNMLVSCSRLRRLFAESALSRQAQFRALAADRG